MATTSKSNVWAQVEAILASHKVKTIVVDELKVILAPKTGSVSNPSYVQDGITFHYCRFHKQFEAEQDMVMSVGKSKGYCKASISLWNKTNAQIKRLEASAVGELTRDNIDKAKELSNEAKAIGERLNDPEFYNYDKDWAIFNGQASE